MQVTPDCLLVGGERGDGLVDEMQLFRRREAIGAALGDAFPDLRFQARDADHEELVQIIGGNRQKPDPLQYRMIGIDRLFQHPAIEVKPGQFPVDDTLGALGNIRTGRLNRIFAFNYRCFNRVHDLTC